MNTPAARVDGELPLVSVLVSAFNHEAFLARSLDSVLAQDYPADRMQIVLVDDGSSDATPEVVKPYLDRVTYIRKPNGGLLSTVNRLFSEARGELLALQSGDDVSLPGRLRRQVERLLERPEVGLVYGDMRVIDGEDRTLSESLWQEAKITPLRGRVLPQLMMRNVVSGGTMMVRASLLDRFHPIPRFAAWEDWWTALRVAEVAEIDYIDAPLLGYRRHGANMNLGTTGRAQLEVVREELSMRRWIITELDCPDASAESWLQVHATWTWMMQTVAQGLGEPLEPLAPVDAAARAAADTAIDAAGELLASGDQAGALREAVRAAGHDPWRPEAVAAVEVCAHAVRGSAAPPALADARGFVTLADAEELIAEPALLSAYGRVFDGSDDASLTVLVSEPRVDALVTVVEACGLASDTAADIVAIPTATSFGAAAQELARGVHAVLSRRAPAGSLAVHRHVGGDDVEALRDLAARHWAYAA